MPCSGPNLVRFGSVLALLTGCATPFERQVDRSLDRFIGMPEAMAAAVLGPPVGRVVLPDGDQRVSLLVIRDVETGGFQARVPRSETVSGTSIGPGGVRTYVETRTGYLSGPWLPGGTLRVSCTVTFQLDRTGWITSYDYVDNDPGGTDRGYYCSQVLAGL
jgi:hypothetical protein